MVGWVPGATWHALRAVRRYRPDVLYSTLSPASAHLVGLMMSRATGIPWVADFRDAWTRNPQGERLARPFAGLSARLERAVVSRASYLVVVDESVELLDVDPGDPRLVVIQERCRSGGRAPAHPSPPRHTVSDLVRRHALRRT